MKFLKKLQNKPENIRKIILWVAIIIIGLALIFLWVINVKRNIQKFQKEDFIKNFNLSEFEEKMKDLPKIEMPEIDEEEFKKLEE